MLPLLTCFYEECILPKILDSRYNRNMPIRNHDYIIKAKEEVCKKRKNKSTPPELTCKTYGHKWIWWLCYC